MKSLFGVLGVSACLLFANSAFADLFLAEAPQVFCEDLLRPEVAVASPNVHSWTSFPQTRVSLNQNLEVKTKGIWQFEVKVRVEDHLRNQGKEVRSTLFVQMSIDPVPLVVDLDEILKRWGLERDPEDRTPVTAAVISAKSISSARDAVQLDLLVDAKAYSRLKNTRYLPQASGRYRLTLTYHPNDKIPISETYRIQLDSLPVLKASNKTELLDPRRVHSVNNHIRYHYVNAWIQVDENNPKKAQFKVLNIPGTEPLFEEEIKSFCGRDCALVYSERINNSFSSQVVLPEYFSGSSPHNSLVYILGTNPSPKEPAKILVYRISQNPATRSFDLHKKEFLGPIGYRLRKIDQSENNVMFYFENLDPRFASSIVVESKKRGLVHN